MVEDREPVLPFGSFLFPRVFRAFRMSIQPTKLILAFLAITAVCVTGRVMDFNKTVGVVPNGTTELDAYVSGAMSADDYLSTFADVEEKDGVFTTLWNFGARRFHDALTSLAEGNVLGITQNVAACFTALLWAFRYHTIYSAIFFAVTLAVMSLAGGAICRIAALQFAQGEKPGLTEALQFGLRKFYSFLSAPITPVAIIAVIGIFVVLLGLGGNIPVAGELSVGLFLPLALLAAALTAVIAIGALAGFNLMFPAIAYEDSDCFDAISRSFSYVYAMPWRMGFYTAIAAVYGAICYAFVRFFAYLLLWITRQFLEFGFVNHNEKLANLWPRPDFTDFLGSHAATPTNWSTSAGAFLIHVWVLVVVALMVAFVISFYFCANTIIYALMRNRVDKTALDEIYTGTDEMAAELSPPPAPVDKATEAEPADATEKPPATSE
ncbi:MAG: hypothetical protein JSW27_16240 [Phycisphaerales bacterium]|nr:MAG: hypothetical protein JSW27_16240 [Phycisphaerales bacterium]